MSQSERMKTIQLAREIDKLIAKNASKNNGRIEIGALQLCTNYYLEQNFSVKYSPNDILWINDSINKAATLLLKKKGGKS